MKYLHRKTRNYLDKPLMRAASIVAIVIAATSGLLIAPASAASAGCSTTYNFDLVQAQIDNCPGSGAASWGWGYVPSGAGNAVTGYLLNSDFYFSFADGESYDLNVGAGATRSFDYDGAKITKIQICEFLLTLNGLPVTRCSAVVSV
jgi:hypothetical protein